MSVSWRDPNWKTDGAVVCIDLTAEAIEEARSKGYRLIVNHHPCIFPKSRGLSQVVAGSLVFEALRHGIAVVAAHTNFDRSALEVVRSVSEGLGVTPKGRLYDHPERAFRKLAVFVPVSHVEEVRKAVTEAGAGHVGNYDSCTFGSPGEGTFRGGEGTHPFLGSPGVLEKAQEVKLETLFPDGLQKQILTALRSAHPYEEIAYDLYPVEQEPPSVGLIRGAGYGFWGEFPSPKPFSDLTD